jgi:hypothetical protein
VGKGRVWRRSKDKEHRPPTGSEMTVEMIFLGELLGTKDAFSNHHLFKGSSHYDVAMSPRVAAAGLGCKLAGMKSECCWVEPGGLVVEDVLLQVSTGLGGAALTPREPKAKLLQSPPAEFISYL